jgi:hypothetical protein
MRNIVYVALTTLTMLTSCNNPTTIDIEKWDRLVKKYDLLKFPNLPQPILLTVDEFFDGNNDVGSIAPNLDRKPELSEYHKILKQISDNPKVVGGFVEIKEVMIYENGVLNDNEWFYTDIVYFIGDITKEEIRDATKALMPDNVDYEKEGRLVNLDKSFEGKNVVYVWWD